MLIVEEEVDPKTAQSILRHTGAGLTMNIYTHAQDPAKRAVLEKFESWLCLPASSPVLKGTTLPSCSRFVSWLFPARLMPPCQIDECEECNVGKDKAQKQTYTFQLRLHLLK